MNMIILAVFFMMDIFVTKTDVSIKTWTFCYSFYFYENQTSVSVNIVSVDLDLRWETRLDFTDDPTLVYDFFVVFWNFMSVGCSKYLYFWYIFRFKYNLDIRSWRKEPKIESFKHIFLYIFLINRTKIVESFDIFEHLASLWLEISRNTNNWSMNMVHFSSSLNYLSLLW